MLLLWDIENIRSDKFILAESRVFINEKLNQVVLVSNDKDITAKHRRSVTLREGLQAIIDHYDTNTDISGRGCYLYHALKDYDKDSYSEFHSVIHDIEERDLGLESWEEDS